MKRLLIIALVLSTAAHGQLPGLLGVHRPAVPPPGPVDEDSTVYLVDFGVTSTTTVAQNNTFLTNMQNALKGKGRKNYRIVWPNYTVSASNKTFTQGIDKYRMVGSGPSSTFNTTNNYFIQQGTIFFPVWLGGINDIPAGYKFKSVAKGATALPLVTAGDTANLYVGQRVVLTGLEGLFYGHPPNPRAFEWKVIVGKGGDGVGNAWVVIGAYAPGEPDGTEFRYNDQWKDFLMDTGIPHFFSGKPRIWPIDILGKPNVMMPKQAIWDSMRFISTATGGSVQVAIADNVEWRNITNIQGSPYPYGAIFPNATESFSTTLRNATLYAGHEIDKLVHYFKIYGGRGGSGGGAGVGARYVLFDGFTFTQWADLSPHTLHVRNCFFNDVNTGDWALKTQQEGVTSDKAILKGLSFDNPLANEGHTYLNETHDITFNAGTNYYVDPSDSHAFYLNANKDEGDGKAMSSGYKMMFWKTDGSKRARVYDAIDGGVAGKIKVLTAGDPLANGETWRYTKYRIIVDSGGHTVNKWGVPIFGPADMKWKGNLKHDDDTSSRVTTWTEKDMKFNVGGSFQHINIQGTIQQIVITVNTPATVPARLSFFKDGDNNAWTTKRIVTVDLTQPGTHIINGNTLGGSASGINGSTTLCNTNGTGECAQPALLNGWINTLGVDAFITGNTNAIKPTLPKITITVAWTPYTNQHPLE